MQLIFICYFLMILLALQSCGKDTANTASLDLSDITFSSHVTNLEDIDVIVPPGSANSNEIKPHSYFYIRPVLTASVFAPIPMTLHKMAFYSEEGKNQYLLEFLINDRYKLRFDHIDEPVECEQVHLKQLGYQAQRRLSVLLI